MLPPTYAERYQVLRRTLANLMLNLRQGEQNPVDLKSDFWEAQQYFQTQVATLEVEGLNAMLQSQILSYGTEINKQLRLLAMDWLFLGTARQPQTLERRKALISDRLQLLLTYCDTLLEGVD
jgi:hypothetical protein